MGSLRIVMGIGKLPAFFANCDKQKSIYLLHLLQHRRPRAPRAMRRDESYYSFMSVLRSSMRIMRYIQGSKQSYPHAIHRFFPPLPVNIYLNNLFCPCNEDSRKHHEKRNTDNNKITKWCIPKWKTYIHPIHSEKDIGECDKHRCNSENFHRTV